MQVLVNLDIGYFCSGAHNLVARWICICSATVESYIQNTSDICLHTFPDASNTVPTASQMLPMNQMFGNAFTFRHAPITGKSFHVVRACAR
jgi:hypothetical protein